MSIDPQFLFRVCVGFQKLLCALVVEQGHVPVLEAERGMDMYISFVQVCLQLCLVFASFARSVLTAVKVRTEIVRTEFQL